MYFTELRGKENAIKTFLKTVLLRNTFIITPTPIQYLWFSSSISSISNNEYVLWYSFLSACATILSSSCPSSVHLCNFMMITTFVLLNGVLSGITFPRCIWAIFDYCHTVSTPDAPRCYSLVVYTGRDKATIANHLNFVSVRHE